MPKLTHFQYTADSNTGLSAVYDAAKMKIEEVKFDFRKYKLVVVDNLPANSDLKPGEIYVKQNDKGLEVALYNTENEPAAPSTLLFDKLDLKPGFKLTEKAFEEKHSNDKDAKTLKQNILKELFTLGLVIQPFNLKIHKITPNDPKEKPFLVAINHAKSGTNKEKDGPPRLRERKEINRISRVLHEKYPECTHFVWTGDSNEPAYELKAGVETAKDENDLQVCLSGLTNESIEVGGDNLVLTDIGLPLRVIDKARIVGCRANAQSEKGGETGNARLSAKAITMVFTFQTPTENNKNANAEATARILEAQTVPKGEVLPLHSGKTFGSDHFKTKVVRVNGIAMDTQPLLETAGPRGFHSYESIYKKPYDDADIKIEQASGSKLTELILLEMAKISEEKSTPFALKPSTLKVFAYTALGITLGAGIGAALALSIGFLTPIVLAVALGTAGLLGLLTLGYASYSQSIPQSIKKLDFKAREKIIHPVKKAKGDTGNPLVEELTKDWEKQTSPPRLYAVLKAWIESPEQKAANELLSKKPDVATEADIKKIFTEYFKKKDGRIIDAIFRAEKIELSGGFTYLANPRPDQLASYDNMVGTVDLRLAAGDGAKNHAEKDHPEYYDAEMLTVCSRLNKLSASEATNALETSTPAPSKTASPAPKEGPAVNPAITFSDKGTKPSNDLNDGKESATLTVRKTA